ncbi:F-box domain-containing protein [Favolaschia claudopus]|uniref:F-box domain-containing protein n=1 Tax=Favolaschia claudopus TaxID=2862362 RepID=A0AAW0BDB3_9AGAR
MRDNSLPDELISEILSPALKVADHVFSNTSHVSPFAAYGESTSAYLLVCKSWLRVATPLLYSVVVLRSKAQAKALAAALSGNPELGRFIKKLRVEGGFGPAMQTVLRCSPNVTDLFLTLEIYSSDNVGGLCKGLGFINPSNLILQNFRHKPLNNKMVSQLLKGLSQALRKWDQLVVFDCPFQGSRGAAATTILPILVTKEIHTLVIPSIRESTWAYAVFKACPLKTIQVREPINEFHLENLGSKDPGLMAILEFTAETTRKPKAPGFEQISEFPVIAPSLNPSFIPLADAPREVRDQLWARILSFAILATSRKLALLLISKSFYRLALPFYYEHLIIRRTQLLLPISSILTRETTLGSHIRTLTVDCDIDSDDPSDDEDTGDTADGESLKVKPSDSIIAILSRTNKLVKFRSGSRLTETSPIIYMDPQISLDAFETLAECSGSTLREFLGRVQAHDHASPIAFNSLKALQTLWWRCDARFPDVTAVSPNALQSLEVLRISCAHPSFLSVLSEMKLPSLRNVILSERFTNQSQDAFFRTHGPKLTELSISDTMIGNMGARLFELCPNLSVLILSDEHSSYPPNYKHFHPLREVPSLVKIVFKSYYGIHHKDIESSWNNFFTNFKPRQCLTGLREMRFRSYKWPTSEREIAKSSWVRWAETMLTQGVTLVDLNGTKWRSRLKVK